MLAEYAAEPFFARDGRFRAIADLIPTPLWMSDARGQMIYFNKWWLELYGTTLEESLGTGWTRSLHPDDRERVTAFARTMSAEARYFELEHRIIRHDGEERSIIVMGRPYFNESGAFVGYVGSCLDVTQRNAAQAALHKSEAQLRGIIDHTPAIVYVKDPDGRYLLANRRWSEYVGFDHKKAQGLTDDDLFPAEMAAEVRKTDRRVIETGEPVHREERVKTVKGDVVFASVKFPLYDSAGNLIAIAGMSTDVTEQVRAQEALARREAQFNAVLKYSPAVVYLKDDKGRYLFANDKWKEILDIAPEDVVGHTDKELWPDDVARAVRANDYKVLEAGGALSFEERIPHADGEHIYATVKFPIQDPTGRGQLLAGMSLDITDRIRSAREIQEQARKLEEYATELKRSNADLEQFAYVASHDLQEPLRMVASYCQLLKRRYAATLDEKANEFINFAVDGAQRMQALIDELLAYSRVGRGGQKIDRVNCNDVINRVRANLHKTLVDAGATIETGDLPTVMGYTSLVERLFANIISNAVKFRREEPPVVRVAATREGNAWRFSISDNGIGIDPAYADRVFVIFQRLHARHEYPGTGMGLAICKKIVEHHGGKIWLESVPGRGSTFHFTLPAEGGET